MEFENMINTIQLGDCYELIKSIPDKSIDCIYTDIPYLMSFSGGGTMINKLKKYVKNEVKNICNGINYSIFEDFISKTDYEINIKGNYLYLAWANAYRDLLEKVKSGKYE